MNHVVGTKKFICHFLRARIESNDNIGSYAFWSDCSLQPISATPSVRRRPMRSRLPASRSRSGCSCRGCFGLIGIALQLSDCNHDKLDLPKLLSPVQAQEPSA
jgi:hypothetical protein